MKIRALTKEQQARFPHYVEKWTAIGLSSTHIDRQKHDAAICEAYKAAELGPPVIIYTPCPLSGALAASVFNGMTKSVRSAVGSAVYSAVYSAVNSAVNSAVYSAVDSAVHSAVDLPVGSAVYLAVRSAVDSAVDSAVESAVDSAVRSAVDSAVGSAVYSAVGSAVGEAVESVKLKWIYWLWGNQWAGYAAWGDFFRQECGVDVADWAITLIQHGHYIWPLDGVCFASERPIAIRTDERGRSHCEDGPAVEYASGWGPYCWHGVVVPPEWIIGDKPLTAEQAIKWDNMEQRRAACEIVGWANILRELNARTVDKNTNPFVGELLEVEIPDVGREKFLKVLCGTDREFALPVPPEMERASQAQAWLNFTTEDMYLPQLRT